MRISPRRVRPMYLFCSRQQGGNHPLDLINILDTGSHLVLHRPGNDVTPAEQPILAICRWIIITAIRCARRERDLLFSKKNQHGIRPLSAVTKHAPPQDDTRPLSSTRFYTDVVSYFSDYPAESLMSNDSRAVLYSLIRTRRPTYIAEIGTLRAGTTQVMARATWENNWGIIYTTDPFGGERCPPIIATWPEDLRKYVSFHPLSSMDFFAYLDLQRISLDMTLVDGNHDFEFALFDVQAAARRTRPSGIIVMDNAEQSGPFNAARLFLSLNPAWRELGSAIASHDTSNPFNTSRASAPGTTFIILQAPDTLSIGEFSQSWGQVDVEMSHLDGLTFTLAGRRTSGTLHYHAVFRSFEGPGAGAVEVKKVGRIRIEPTAVGPISDRFDQGLRLPEGALKYTLEIDMSWLPDSGHPPIELAELPRPLIG